jgi:lipopolysaccharide/colanic/teichoic acid biosynthesis glycosyltransferase
VFDLTVCIISLPVLFVPVVLISLAILIDSPGFPIFIQDRVGKGGRMFRLYKFRTFRHDHDDRWDRAFMQAFVAGDINGVTSFKAFYKPVAKDSLTRVGKLLRKTSLDELPQVINVLKGEMSLIGPRPNVTWETEKYQSWHFERLDALPGITGLAQVQGRSNITFDEIAKHDIFYVRNQSLTLDLWILWRTLIIVLIGQGAG